MPCLLHINNLISANKQALSNFRQKKIRLCTSAFDKKCRHASSSTYCNGCNFYSSFFAIFKCIIGFCDKTCNSVLLFFAMFLKCKLFFLCLFLLHSLKSDIVGALLFLLHSLDNTKDIMRQPDLGVWHGMQQKAFQWNPLYGRRRFILFIQYIFYKVALVFFTCRENQIKTLIKLGNDQNKCCYVATFHVHG